MAVSRLNALLYRPGAVWIVLQKFFVVIGLDHEGLDLTQTLDDQTRGVTEIGNKAEPTGTGVESEPDRIDGVMRHRKSFDRDIANRKIGAGAKNAPVAMRA